MQFKYVSREDYRRKYSAEFLDALQKEFGDFYIVPEGGSNTLAVKGCAEILENININFDVICCACGTGGTIAGIISSTPKKVLGFPALKGGEFLKQDINNLLKEYSINSVYENWELILDYHFGGYAKVKPELIEFVRRFYISHNIKLDLIYTGKMLYGIYDLLKNTKQLDNQTIIAIHTGGIQGNKGLEQRLRFTLFS